MAIEATHDAPRTTHVSADALTVFKALQLLRSRDMTPLARFVTFDFETTDKDVDTCGVVEIGAVRVVNGEIVERFHALVNRYLPISPQATAGHGYTDADVADAGNVGPGHVAKSAVGPARGFGQIEKRCVSDSRVGSAGRCTSERTTTNCGVGASSILTGAGVIRKISVADSCVASASSAPPT